MRHRRHGWTLIEMIAAMATGSIVVGVATMTLMIALGGTQKQRVQWNETQALNRLAAQFRQDVHQATTATAGDNDMVSLSSGDSTIVYRFANGRIDREESKGAKIVRRESYFVHQKPAVTINNPEPGATTFVRLRLERTFQEKTETTSPALLIEAQLARDHRFEQDAKVDARDEVSP